MPHPGASKLQQPAEHALNSGYPLTTGSSARSGRDSFNAFEDIRMLQVRRDIGQKMLSMDSGEITYDKLSSIALLSQKEANEAVCI